MDKPWYLSPEYLAKRFSERIWDVLGDLFDHLSPEDAEELANKLVIGLLIEIGEE